MMPQPGFQSELVTAKSGGGEETHVVCKYGQMPCRTVLTIRSQVFHGFFMDEEAHHKSARKCLIFQVDLWWARQGLNLRPHPCEGCALPLSYAPACEANRPGGEGRAFAMGAPGWQD